MATHAPQNVELKFGYYYAAVAISVIPAFITFIIALFGLGFHVGSVSIPYWPLLLMALAPYYLASVSFIQTNEFGGIMVFETPARELAQGPVYAPLWLTELARFPRAMQQEQFPGEPEQISNMPDDEADRARSTLLEPIRITTGGPEQGGDADAYKDDLLNERITFEPTITVQWQVEQHGFFEFYVNVPGNDWAAKYRNLLKIMRDSAENALNIEMSRHSAGWAISNKEHLVQAVAERISRAVSHWGIMVCEVNILNITPSHEVNIALGRIPEAKANSQATGINADAEKNRLIKEAEGRAKARELELTAEGKGLKAAADELGMSGADYRASEIAEKLAGSDNAIIVGVDGFAQALALGKAVMGGKK